MDKETIYNGMKKCVLNDYPFEIKWNDNDIFPIFSACYEDIIQQHSRINNSYYSCDSGGYLRIDFLDHYVILCYRFAKALYKNNMGNLADAVYYSSRVRCSIDLYYPTEIGECFIPVHALGTIVDSHAKYGTYFQIYNECHIGPYSYIGKEPKDCIHPVFGDFVTMLGHSRVFGNTTVGNNVIISAGTVIINENIPDNCIVSGSSPNLMFQKLKISNQSIVR